MIRSFFLLAFVAIAAAQQQHFQFECEYEAAGNSNNHRLDTCSDSIQQNLFATMGACVKHILACRFGTGYTAENENLSTYYSLSDSNTRRLQEPDPSCTLCLMYGLDCSAVCGCFPDPCDNGDRTRQLRRRLEDGCDQDHADLSVANEITLTCGQQVMNFVKDLSNEDSCLGHWTKTECLAVVKPV